MVVAGGVIMLLSRKGQTTGGLMGTLAAVAGALFILILFTVMTDKTRTALDSNSATVNSTLTNVLDGAEDASDMGGLLMLMVILGAVFSVALGAFVLRR